MKAKKSGIARRILVCSGPGCVAGGALKLADNLRKAIEALGADAKVECGVENTGCSGMCELGPIVRILPDDIMYYQVKPKDAVEIVSKTIIAGDIIGRLLYKTPEGKTALHQDDNPFYAKQTKIALRNTGAINPRDIDAYIARGGYAALKKALSMTPEEIIAEVDASGLRGRGGAGFPTGRKWKSARAVAVEPKYVVCNGDEGDPGAFMDGAILNGDPHSVIEGMVICALAVGSQRGYMYIRDEYVLALDSVKRALKTAEERGFIGENILGSGKSFTLSVVRGGGAFVCGESTALMKSIEGKVGEPRAKYIHSTEQGLWGCPTVLNNVETFANIPWIIANGGAEYAKIGTPGNTGTKVFALVGKVKHTGLVEVPLGATLRTLIYDIGGGIQNDRPLKAIQTGGPSGGTLPADLIDLPVDFDTLAEYGTMMGSGGLIVMDDRTCMVEFARYYVQFLCGESCGKCTPCREGLRHMRDILTNICNGRGREGDIELLEEIGHMMQDCSLCALGKTAPNPVLSSIRYFRDEYEEHIKQYHCRAGMCPELTAFRVNPQKCIGCRRCAEVCPTGVISGSGNQAHFVDIRACIGCGACRDVCPVEAFETIPVSLWSRKMMKGSRGYLRAVKTEEEK
ncbi:MAG TPA: 4Fe-4S binding protein [Methanocorpusculum sp.]|nr:4Fe-4S binding protein [Methanocorpusculum sp.]